MSDMTDMIACESLWKSYQRHRRVGLKSLFVGAETPRDSRFSRQWALNDVSFRVARGQAFGVVGHNGSGKSTLLSILLGTVMADRGRIAVNGRVASLLELGAGFHPDLTGRENIFLFGSILGMTLREIRQRADAIVEFSELESAIETPLRTYSAGMITRLGFSIIVQSPADVLLIDEVLGVGDARFQEKCRSRLREFKKQNGTLVIVSHNMAELAQVCDDGLCLDLGQVVDAGPMDRVIAGYEHRMARVPPARP
jgi:lipopolysaccharide transport system ATP-binding protein